MKEIEDDDDYVQKHLLSRPTATWGGLEDTRQANYLALNASETSLVVGEHDGRVTIWDNATVRIITRELDPTRIALSTMESPTGEQITAAQVVVEVKKIKTDAEVGEIYVDNDDGSIENEDESASVEEEEATEEEEADNILDESEETKTGDEVDTVGGGAVFTLSYLRVVEAALKVVSQCAWSCDPDGVLLDVKKSRQGEQDFLGEMWRQLRWSQLSALMVQ